MAVDRLAYWLDDGVTGDRSTEVSGKLDQVKGKIEKKIGQAKDKIRR